MDNMKVWVCDKCGSEYIMQEYSAYLPMNEEFPIEIGDMQGVDSFWCNNCNEECSPVTLERWNKDNA